jgi:CDP-4-dehydro-6-deoxyglucose reductase
VLEAVGDRRDMQVYMCGMKAMVDQLRQQLKALGFDRKQIVFEKYD